MRHFLAAGAVPGLAGRMAKPTGAALLIEPAGPLQRDPTRMIRAGARAVAVSAVADPAQEEELLAVRSDADDQPQRIHALPRSGRGGWTTTTRCAKKGAATRALPRCVPPEGPGCRDSGPSPLNAVGGNDLPQLTRPRNYSRDRPVVYSAVFGDRQQPNTWPSSPTRGGAPTRARPARSTSTPPSSRRWATPPRAASHGRPCARRSTCATSASARA